MFRPKKDADPARLIHAMVGRDPAVFNLTQK
jgi:hypothetical protein